jgi:hypothetical protein
MSIVLHHQEVRFLRHVIIVTTKCEEVHSVEVRLALSRKQLGPVLLIGRLSGSFHLLLQLAGTTQIQAYDTEKS